MGVSGTVLYRQGLSALVVRRSSDNGRLGIAPRPASLPTCSSAEGPVGLLPCQQGGGLLYASYSTPQLVTGIPKIRKISVGAAFSACIGEGGCIADFGQVRSQTDQNRPCRYTSATECYNLPVGTVYTRAQRE